MVFLDTSAFLAVIDRDDSNHPKAKKAWIDLLENDDTLVTNNYALLECLALLQHRIGMNAVKVFVDDILPLINVEWIGEETHNSALSAMLAASRKNLSCVDCVCFETMRSFGIKKAFVFDRHFREQGFDCIP
jgi:predicted nucleic acid-binding protein